ncbi:outer membrane protein [Thalassovita sp.]|uniref:outer membrane protein n=1 Tax=Thalassovita sp. TaxID=1979401 RepID=UPI0029DE5A1A|nr:outer membrane beta-barrel protein [Thalassovita sp.]
MIGKSSLAMAIATALALPAYAGGMQAPEPAADVLAPASSDWTGFYTGLHAGSGDRDIGFGPFSINRDHTIVGVHAGYTHDFGNYALSGEVSFEKVDAGGSDDVDRIGVALKAGYDAGRVMPYISVGLASLDMPGPLSDERGFSYGFGVNFLATDRLMLGLEYRHTKYDDDYLGIPGAEMAADSVILSASYRF